jgi:hypothetical protein
VVAGFTGLRSAGWTAGVLGSPGIEKSKSLLTFEEIADFGEGASGREELSFMTGLAIALALVAVEVKGTEGCEASPDTVLQQNKRSAVRTKDHLSDCRPGEGFRVNCNYRKFTVLRDRRHWTIGPVLVSTHFLFMATSVLALSYHSIVGFSMHPPLAKELL